MVNAMRKAPSRGGHMKTKRLAGILFALFALMAFVLLASAASFAEEAADSPDELTAQADEEEFDEEYEGMVPDWVIEDLLPKIHESDGIAETIDSVSFAISPVQCGTRVTVERYTIIEFYDESTQNPKPTVDVAQDPNYWLEAAYWMYWDKFEQYSLYYNELTWVISPPQTNESEDNPGSIRGQSMIVKVDINSTEEDLFADDIKIDISGGKLLSYEPSAYYSNGVKYNRLSVYVEIPVEHGSAATKTENVVAASGSSSGSHDEVTYCTRCGDELSRTTVIDSPTSSVPATGDTTAAFWDTAAFYSLVFLAASAAIKRRRTTQN